MSRDPQINVRLPQDLKEAVQNMAADNKRSVNAEIVAVLLDAVRKHNLSPIDGTEGMLARANEYILPSELLEVIATRAAEAVVKIQQENKDKPCTCGAFLYLRFIAHRTRSNQTKNLSG